MWRSLLKGINWFPESYGEDEDEDKGENKDRMDKLVKFVVAKGSSEMKTLVLREIASRFGLITVDKYYYSTQKGGRCERPIQCDSDHRGMGGGGAKHF